MSSASVVSRAASRNAVSMGLPDWTIYESPARAQGRDSRRTSRRSGAPTRDAIDDVLIDNAVRKAAGRVSPGHEPVRVLLARSDDVDRLNATAQSRRWQDGWLHSKRSNHSGIENAIPPDSTTSRWLMRPSRTKRRRSRNSRRDGPAVFPPALAVRSWRWRVGRRVRRERRTATDRLRHSARFIYGTGYSLG